MKLVEWTEELSVKNGVIDGQHKQLIAKINELAKAVEKNNAKDVIVPILDFFFEHLMQHSSYEEEYMQKYNFPEVENHKLIHKKMLESVRKTLDKVENEDHTQELAVEIKQKIGDMFVNHLKTQDKKYAEFIEKFPN